MRLLSTFIFLICALPILLILGGWVSHLSIEESQYWAHIREYVLSDDILGSLKLMTEVALLSGFLGILTAWKITQYQFPFRNLLSWALVLPFAMPSYILAMCYGNLLDFAGPVQSAFRDFFAWGKGDYDFPEIRSEHGAAFILALATYPYVYLMAKSAFEAQPSNWIALAKIFGHAEKWAILRLSLGAARPFLILGITLAVMEAAADIGVSSLFGLSTLSTGLYRIWVYGDHVILAARMGSLLILVAALILLIERFARRRARYASIEAGEPIERTRLSGTRAWVSTLVVMMPLILGFVIPLIWTIQMAIWNTRFVRLERVLASSLDSLWLAILGSIFVVLSAFVITLSERRFGKSWLFLIGSLGYALPGIVIAISLLIVQKFALEHFGIRLLMTGSVLGLILAYLSRFLAPAYQSLHAGITRISPEFDMMATCFGKNHWQIFWNIHLPQLRSSIFYATILVAVDIFKELPASLILRPFNLKPLAITVFEFAGADRPAEAAPYALILIAVCTSAVYVLAKLNGK